MSFTLQLATLDEVSTLSRIFGDAFATDTHTQMKMAENGPDEMIKGMQGAITSWIESNTVTKAVQNETNAIMGWVCWERFGYEKGVSSEEDLDMQPQQNESQQQGKQAESPLQQTDKSPLEQLEVITNDDLKRWMVNIMQDGSKCRYIVAIVTDPKFQKCGVGSALIRKGTEQADKDGVICWVHASEAGYKAFKQHDFIVKETLQVDLDKYAPVPPPDGMNKWGDYTFRYMVRSPRSH